MIDRYKDGHHIYIYSPSDYSKRDRWIHIDRILRLQQMYARVQTRETILLTLHFSLDVFVIHIDFA